MSGKIDTENLHQNRPANEAGSQMKPLKFDMPNDLTLVLKKIRLLVQCRLEWLEYLIDNQANFLQADEPELELQWRHRNLSSSMREIEKCDQQLELLEESSLRNLVSLFGLGKAEVAILQTCLAIRLDPSLTKQLGVLQNQPDKPLLTEYVIARLWCFGRAFSLPSTIPLMQWGLIQNSDMGLSLSVDPQIFNWLLGQHSLHPALKSSAYLQGAEPPLSNWPLQEIKEMVDERLLENADNGVVVQIIGEAGQGKKTFAATLSSEMGLLLLIIDAQKVREPDFPHVYHFAQRQGFLDSCAIGWVNLEYDLPVTPLSNFPLQFIITGRDTVSDAHWRTYSIHVELPVPDDGDKERLWQKQLPSFPAWSQARQKELLQLPCTVADIVEAGKNGDKNLSDFHRRTVKEQQRQLSGLADRLSTPFIREDWIVNESIISIFDDIIFEGRERETLWQSPELNRLFPRGRGLISLLTGPSGTGKTMGVQIAAAELKMELFRVDLSRVVSKYIGETAENLAKIIKRAEKLNVIILFDEAESLFSKRTAIRDSIDRHANMDVNYLLQAIEDYSGICFLASNKKSNIDQSFIRRLRYVVDFPLPEVNERYLLWKRLLESIAADQLPQPHEFICEHLAKQIELTGAQIKFAILTALFIARRKNESLNLGNLLEGITRELLKSGRSLADHERDAIVKGIGHQDTVEVKATALN